MSRALNVLREERALLLNQLRGIDGAITALGGTVARKARKVAKKGKKMSEATKAKIAKAAKARWAKIKKS